MNREGGRVFGACVGDAFWGVGRMGVEYAWVMRMVWCVYSVRLGLGYICVE